MEKKRNRSEKIGSIKWTKLISMELAGNKKITGNRKLKGNEKI